MEANRNDANSSNNSPTAATNKNITFLIDKTNSKTIEAKKISNNSANVAATTTVTTTKNTTILVNTTKSKTYQHHNHHNHHHPHQNQQSSNTSKTEKNRIKSTKMTATQVVQPYFHVQDNQLYQEPTCYYKTYDQLLAERGYRLGRTLGCGSYAKVKEAEQFEPRRKIACKIIDRKKAPSDFLNRFLPRELEIYKKLDHKNIIKVYDTIELGNRVFIFMEIAEGGDLLDYIKNKKGPLPIPTAKRMFYELASAVRYIHSMHITHRDLKCENLLLDRNEHIKLADFGFSRFCIDNGKRILSRTYCGSAAYAAPEILQGQPYNPKLYDIWSLGVILYIMVCGSMPYDDRDVKKMLKAQLSGKVKFPEKLTDELVRELIHHMLEHDVTKRYYIEKVIKHKWLDEYNNANTIDVTNVTTTTTTITPPQAIVTQAVNRPFMRNNTQITPQRISHG